MKLKVLCALLTAVILLFCGCARDDDSIVDLTPPPNNQGQNLRGAWVATVWNIDYPTKTTTNANNLKTEIDTIVTNATVQNLNAIFFQVRPAADAFYKSNIFPWSRFLTGTRGLAPSNNFDPLEYMIQKCHSSGLQLHAWINPLRILDADIIYTGLTITHENKQYFDPANETARELIIDGVREIVQNYNIDGIHYDDYFYPESYGGADGINYTTAATYRTNIDTLIADTYHAVKEINPEVQFGVSPSGIWANKSSNPLGSDTLGFESYYAIHADSRGWVKKGIVDYIAPQIYWYIGQPNADFLTVFEWWRDVCQDTGVKLYIGLAGYKVGTGGAWDNVELDAQMELARDFADGHIVFSFSDLQ